MQPTLAPGATPAAELAVFAVICRESTAIPSRPSGGSSVALQYDYGNFSGVPQQQRAVLGISCSAKSPRDRQPDQRVGGMVERVEMAAGIDQPVVLRFADRQAGGDRADAARLRLEIPDEFAAGALARVAPAVLGEDCDARPEQRPAHRRD